jgi:hypothetical protein
MGRQAGQRDHGAEVAVFDSNGLHAAPHHAQPVSTEASVPLRWSPTAPVPDHDEDLAPVVAGLGRNTATCPGSPVRYACSTAFVHASLTAITTSSASG